MYHRALANHCVGGYARDGHRCDCKSWPIADGISLGANEHECLLGSHAIASYSIVPLSPHIDDDNPIAVQVCINTLKLLVKLHESPTILRQGSPDAGNGEDGQLG